MSTEQKKIQIVVMDRHFLYLPLYYAKNKSFFGFIPDHYEIEIIVSADHTDESAYEMLMDTGYGKSTNVDFAVADPTMVLTSSKFDRTPAILAALISNTAFWAVDRKTHQIVLPKDLADFQQIIAFKPGSTSHSIALRIFRDAKKPQAIHPVNPTQELVALQKTTNTVALSPDILGIDHLLYYEKHFNIDLALGTTQEFSNVFMTALLSRQDIVENHRALVLGLLKALQLSLILVRAQAPELIDYAADRFSDSKDRVRSALNRAEQAQVFPPSVEVSVASWLNAAKIWYESKGVNFEAAEQTEAKLKFQNIAQPHLRLAKTAVDELYSQVSTPPKEKRSSWSSAMRASAAAILCFVIGSAVIKWCHWSAIGVFMLGTTISVLLATWLKLKRASPTCFLHWFYCASFQLVLFAWLSPTLKGLITITTYIPLSVAAALLLLEIKLVHDERKKA
jgi:hypothetical protein